MMRENGGGMKGTGNNRARMIKCDWGCGEKESGIGESEVVTKGILSLTPVETFLNTYMNICKKIRMELPYNGEH